MADGLVGGESGLDLAQLDAEAAQLDLVVPAADELQLAARIFAICSGVLISTISADASSSDNNN
ncbi:hypothetical protein [Streptomyces tardus]|uniref:hypothetical protein n=1 Tax=Streptomyces tardus TaxID=2780544 RepID=UPI001F3A9B37|nr:hypothetical protein [Streptomyces tardus]